MELQQRSGVHSFFNKEQNSKPSKNQEKQDEHYAIIKYDIKKNTSFVYQIDKDSGSNRTAYHFLQQAEANSEIRCYCEKITKQYALILDFVQLRALVVLKLVKKKQEDSYIGQARQHKQIDLGKCIKLIRQWDKNIKQNIYWSVSKPETEQKNAFGYNEAKVMLTNVLQNETTHKPLQQKIILLGVNHFENKVLSYVATLTDKG